MTWKRGLAFGLGLAVLSCGGGGEDAVTSSCSQFDSTACEAQKSCLTVLGGAVDDGCSPALTEFAGCVAADASCEAVETCGIGLDGKLQRFANSCLPDGWSRRDLSECCPGSTSWFECEQPSDCVVLELGCCGHCNGDQVMSVNVEYAAMAQEKYGDTSCEDVECAQQECPELVGACTASVCAWTEPAGLCDGLDEAACEAAEACEPARLGALPTSCGPDPQYGDFVGCVASCSGQPSCAADPATGLLGILPSGCLPAGWKALAIEGCCTPVDCPALEAEPCKAEAQCVLIEGKPHFDSCADPAAAGEDPDAFCVTAKGCEAVESCAKSPDGSRLAFSSSCIPFGWTAVDAGACCPDPCPALAPTECEASEQCAPLLGAPSGEICAGDYDNWMSIAAGCMDKNLGCGEAETCAQEGEGTILVFPSTCLPAGWTEVAWQECCVSDPCSTVPPELCSEVNGCAPIMGTPKAGLCTSDSSVVAVPLGCGPVDQACDEAETCAALAGGEPMVFPTTCIPSGWTELSYDECCAPPECGSLSGEACGETVGCSTLLGAPTEEVCAGDYSNWMSVPAGCMSAEFGCGDAETCAEAPDGTKLYFPSTCIPEGWKALTSEECCPPAGPCAAGDYAPVGKLCVRGEMVDGVEKLIAGASATIQLFPKGCFSTSCTLQYATSCAIGAPVENKLAASGKFCLGTEGDICTPDCSGGGFANCDSAPLAAGDYTVTLEELELGFSVPAELPLGGLCVGSPF